MVLSGRTKMASGEWSWRLLVLALLPAGPAAQAPPPALMGLQLEDLKSASFNGGVIRVPPGRSFSLRLNGVGLLNASWAWLGFSGGGVGTACRGLGPQGEGPLQLEPQEWGGHWGLVTVTVPEGSPAGLYHLCTRTASDQPWDTFADAVVVVDGKVTPSCPPWLLGILAALAVVLSGLARGLQLSSLSLDPVELHVLRECGSQTERRNAKRLERLRRCGTVALVATVIPAAVANAAAAVLLYLALGLPAPAIFLAAGCLMLAGELAPAALASRWGLVLGARSLWLTHLCMAVTFPLSFPLGKLLDLAFRHDISRCLLREKVVDMMRNGDPYNEFVKEEFSKGALRNKTVEDILTPVRDCFMLSAGAVLDFSTMSQIMQSGYTRIPVYEEERSNIVDILYVKDLGLVDPDDCTPLSTITKFYNHPLHFVFNDTKLDAVLEEFKRGKSHMAIVQKVNNEGEGDPFYEVMGLVTLEDVIEIIIKSEIMDESDDYKEHKVKKKQPAPLNTVLERRKEDFSLFKVPEIEHKAKISPQLLLATQRFLSREVDLFSPSRISEKVLLHLLKHPSVNHEVKFDETNRQAHEHYLYERNQPVDYFILILQGRVEVEIGKEGLKFENGAFTYYGASALTSASSVHPSPVSTIQLHSRDQFDTSENVNYSMYCPDYTVRALTDLQLIKVTKIQYVNALMASRVNTSPQSPESLEMKILPNSQTKLLNQKNTSSSGNGKSITDITEEENVTVNPVK
ncbi:metal transporter CNNM3 isoform X1 [Pleurodeles waltl]|uniref:metal transporter CNNM3 isoform X1 n=1 Tax=Pleurodeles waltl TaxID=8319 RepID=UPI003709634D